MPDKGGYGAVRNRTLLLHLTLLERDELSSNIEPTMRTYPCNPTKGESIRPPTILGISESPHGILSQKAILIGSDVQVSLVYGSNPSIRGKLHIWFPNPPVSASLSPKYNSIGKPVFSLRSHSFQFKTVNLLAVYSGLTLWLNWAYLLAFRVCPKLTYIRAYVNP